MAPAETSGEKEGFEKVTIERRQHKRLPVNLPVTLRYKGSLIPATALNISCGGVCLSTDNPDVVGGGDVEIVMDLSREEPDVSVRGKIVRINPGTQKKVGIQFTNLFSIGHKAIEKFIQRNRN